MALHVEGCRSSNQKNKYFNCNSTLLYLFQYVGLPIYYFNLDKYRLIEPNKYITLKVFAATSLTITLLILGFIAAKNHIGKLNYRLYFNKINTKLINNKRLLLINSIILR